MVEVDTSLEKVNCTSQEQYLALEVFAAKGLVSNVLMV
jgi:hypothetical protein